MKAQTQNNQQLVSYADRPDRPVVGYAVLLGVFTLSIAALVAAREQQDLNERSPEAQKRPRGLGEWLLTALTVHRLTNAMASDRVTSVLRLPFEQFKRRDGDWEAHKRGQGLHLALSQLFTCPFCLGPWVSGLVLSLWARRPEAARVTSEVFGLTALSDWFHQLYKRSQPKT